MEVCRLRDSYYFHKSSVCECVCVCVVRNGGLCLLGAPGFWPLALSRASVFREWYTMILSLFLILELKA